MTLTKTFAAEVKQVDDSTGTFEALVSVFGNIDLVGDRVMPGAFAKTLESWRASGDPIPVTWSHDWTLDGFIGEANPADVQETDRGLVVKARLDLTDANGRKAHDLLKRRLVKNFSFSYEIPDGGSKRVDGVNELHALDLIEVGPTLVGANRATELIDVKSSPASDDSTWDGNKAMAACSTAAEYRSICAGERSDGAPDERQHWALPHHYLGKAANAAGVANARARFAQTKGLKNAEAARTHLFTTHTLPSDEGKSIDALVTEAADPSGIGVKQGRVLSGANADRLRQVVDHIAQADAILDELLAQLDPGADTDEDDTAEDPRAGKAKDQLDPESFATDEVWQEAQSLLTT